MVQGNAILVVDLGNSSTKATVMFGKTSQGLYKEKSFDLSNAFAEVDDWYEVPDEYSHDKSTVFEVNTAQEGGLYCNGELQQKEFEYLSITPTAVDKKYHSFVTDLTINLTFIHAYKALMEMRDLDDASSLDITWSVVTLLPPGDLSNGKEELEKKFRAVTHIKSTHPKMEKDIKIDSVMVLPEGFCSYAAVVYDKGATYRKGFSFLKEQKVLVLDIGAGTTDCMIIEDNKVISASRHTIPQGGNNVMQQVRQKCVDSGLNLTPASFNKAVITGVVRDGAKPVDLVKTINWAKGRVANYILGDFQRYLESTNINLRDVGYVLVCGGGSIQDTENTNILPLSKQIIERVKRISPETLLVDIPTQREAVSSSNGCTTYKEVPLDARHLNLIGATIMAEIKHK